MSIFLVVVRPFWTYGKGDVVSDAASIADIVSSDKASWVVRVDGAPQPQLARGN
jgi:hypothetical protein